MRRVAHRRRAPLPVESGVARQTGEVRHPNRRRPDCGAGQGPRLGGERIHQRHHHAGLDEDQREGPLPFSQQPDAAAPGVREPEAEKQNHGVARNGKRAERETPERRDQTPAKAAEICPGPDRQTRRLHAQPAKEKVRSLRQCSNRSKRFTE